MTERSASEQVMDGVRCFEKKICRYFDEDGLSRVAFSSWRSLLGTPSGGAEESELSLEAKLKMLKSNLTKFEKSLRDGHVTHIPEFLKNNGFQHPLVHPEVVTAVCSYLLLLVSCHSDPVLVNSAANALSYHAENGAPFAPDSAQVAAIALNMGLKEEFLPGFSREELPQFMREESGTVQRRYPERFNTQQVLGCLTELLRPGRRWTDAARETLFSMLVAMLVDPHMEHILMTFHVTACLDVLLQSYDRAAWGSSTDTSKALDLVELRLLCLPPAARLPVLAGLPRRGRGLELRRIAGYVFLQCFIREQRPAAAGDDSFIDLPPTISVGGVLAVVRGEQVGGLPAAVISSSTAEQLRSSLALLRCVDAAVGPEPPPAGAAHLEHLRQLKELLNSEVDRVKVDGLDDTLELRMRLTEFMTMLHSKWGSMCNN